jgi:hypothetical protein
VSVSYPRTFGSNAGNIPKSLRDEIDGSPFRYAAAAVFVQQQLRVQLEFFLHLIRRIGWQDSPE